MRKNSLSLSEKAQRGAEELAILAHNELRCKLGESARVIISVYREDALVMSLEAAQTSSEYRANLSAEEWEEVLSLPWEDLRQTWSHPEGKQLRKILSQLRADGWKDFMRFEEPRINRFLKKQGSKFKLVPRQNFHGYILAIRK